VRTGRVYEPVMYVPKVQQWNHLLLEPELGILKKIGSCSYSKLIFLIVDLHTWVSDYIYL
jgi:hypothetical protein